MVRVAGFEPTASWTRTKRDTKLRHTRILPNQAATTVNTEYQPVQPLYYIENPSICQEPASAFRAGNVKCLRSICFDGVMDMKHGSRWVRLVAALLLCCLMLAAKHCGIGLAEEVRPWLFGSADNAVAQAFSALSGSLEQGENLGQAVQAFCGEMSGIETS